MAETCEENAQLRSLPEANLHKVYPLHCNKRKNKGKHRDSNATLTTEEKSPIKVTRYTYEPGKVFPTIKGRSLLEGMGSLGSKALHMRARIHKLDSSDVKAWLDSGADITLISEEFWKSMTDSPRLREGMRMKLYHLTGGAKVLGYIKTELYATAQDESIVSFELEAYVVRNMNVPILLGEDFQTIYELSITRQATGQCEVLVGKSGRVIPAASTLNADLGFEIRVAYPMQSIIHTQKGCSSC